VRRAVGAGAMTAPKCRVEDYIDYLVASPRVVSGTEAARAQPPGPNRPAHDAFTRLLHRLDPDPEALWAEAAPLVMRRGGVLVLDDSVLDKPYAKKMDLVARQWSGKHGRVVWGIGLVTLLWSDGEALIPCDVRLYDKAGDGRTKNDHARDLLATAQARGFAPAMVLFDSWYASLANLKAVRVHGWHWTIQLKANRAVNPDGTGTRRLDACAIAATGTRVHLQGYGFIVVFRIVSSDGDTEYWATSDPTLGALGRQKYAELAWGIEVYHRGLKQHCGVERAQVRAARARRVHIGCAIRAFLRLEQHRLVTGTSWWAAKMAIIREAVRLYLAQPRYTLTSTAAPTAQLLLQIEA
jgi:putative transposase